MERRQLGRSGVTVSAMGLGCMGMSQSYGPGNEEESVRTIHRALDLGINFLDTAAVYGDGANEQLVGRAIAGQRRDVVLATKCGIVRGADGGLSRLDGSPGHITGSCEDSLRRLSIDTIDLFYLHRVDPQTPIEESMDAMSTLVAAGKIRFVGLSEAAPTTIRRAHRVHPVAAVQSEYSLWWRDPESAVLPVCRELGIAFVPFSPLGRGFLSARVTETSTLAADDMRRTLPRFQGDNLARNLSLVTRLETIASRMHATPSQLALAWLLAKGPDIVPIPGTKRRTYLESNAAATDLVLAAQDVTELDAMFAETAGERYNPGLMRFVDRG